ncbi:23S rRNA (guanosine(2251)-2'-O)-methyltransferase RlmB, partial [Alphaproteobacteria bacterium]|nr:23S rRNA (guanosine(2251)-2'-O)-methyltransferase RlmB [Alphaproteobacteria bacterium]
MYIYGHHAVQAALDNPKRKINKLFLTANGAQELAETLARLKLRPEIKKPQELAALLPSDAVHQGMVLDCAPLPEPD